MLCRNSNLAVDYYWVRNGYIKYKATSAFDKMFPTRFIIKRFVIIKFKPYVGTYVPPTQKQDKDGGS